MLLESGLHARTLSLLVQVAPMTYSLCLSRALGLVRQVRWGVSQASIPVLSLEKSLFFKMGRGHPQLQMGVGVEQARSLQPFLHPPSESPVSCTETSGFLPVPSTAQAQRGDPGMGRDFRSECG